MRRRSEGGQSPPPRLSRYLEAAQRARQRGLAARVVDLFLRASAQPALRTLSRTLGPRAVDLVRTLGGVGEADHLVVAHLGEAAGDRELVLVTPGAIRHHADPERRE